jgi:hypothetical protein
MGTISHGANAEQDNEELDKSFFTEKTSIYCPSKLRDIKLQG